MKLTQESIQEFIDIYRAEFGVELTCEQAEEMGSELLSFYQLIIPRNPSHA